jgi:Leucine-rich repeat (LRR) protein
MADRELSSRRPPDGSDAQAGASREGSPPEEHDEGSEGNDGGRGSIKSRCISLFAGRFAYSDTAAQSSVLGGPSSGHLVAERNRAGEEHFDRTDQGRLETRPVPSGTVNVEDGKASRAPVEGLDLPQLHETRLTPDEGDHNALSLRPGAFRVALGGPPEGSSVRSSLESGESSSQMHPSPFDNNVSHADMPVINEIYMAEASLVLSVPVTTIPPPLLVTATPLRLKRLWLCFAAGALVIIAVAVGIAFAVIANKRSDPGEEPRPAPSDEATQAPVALAPCTPSPISAAASDFYETLPNYTLTAMQNCSSSQYQAFSWATKEMDLSLDGRMTQRFALATLGFSTGADTKSEWKENSGWLDSTINECSWFGCMCNEAMSIVALNLGYNLQGGTLPREVGLLSALTLLILSGNELTASIPTEISFLKNLSELDLYSNRLTGRLPSELGLLVELELLDVGENLITGTLPSELSLLPALSSLTLTNMLLASTIPTEIGRFPRLTVLSLGGAGLIGRIPSEIGRLSYLTQLDLSRNALTSTIPTEIGSLFSLEVLHLYENYIVGSLPLALLALPTLSNLVMTENAINGTIPSMIGELSRLDLLLMDYNQLSGTIPTELGLLSALTFLRLSANKLSGPIPSEIGFLSDLEGDDVSFDDNVLTGTIPTEFGLLTSVSRINLRHNRLRGSVPNEVCELLRNGLKLQVDCDEVECSCGCACGEIRS